MMDAIQIQELVNTAIHQGLRTAGIESSLLSNKMASQGAAILNINPGQQGQSTSAAHQSPSGQPVQQSAVNLPVQPSNPQPVYQAPVHAPSPPSKLPSTPLSSEQQGLAGQVAQLVIQSLVPIVNQVVSVALENAVKQAAASAATRATETLGAQLQKHSLLLKYENDRIEQYSRRWTIRVHGLVEPDDETNDKLVESMVKIGNTCGVPLQPADISVCHRNGPTKRRNGEINKKRVILCRFISRNTRNLVLAGKKNLRAKEEYNGVYVNEDLTQLRARLFAKARNHSAVENAITRDGRIICYMKDKRQHARPITIESPDDLFKLGENSVDYEHFGLSNFVVTCTSVQA